MAEKKKVVVTGASSGIGAATALRFAREGWDVCVTARREQELRDLVASFPAGDHLVCPGDYSNPATVALIDRSIQENGIGWMSWPTSPGSISRLIRSTLLWRNGVNRSISCSMGRFI